MLTSDCVAKELPLPFGFYPDKQRKQFWNLSCSGYFKQPTTAQSESNRTRGAETVFAKLQTSCGSCAQRIVNASVRHEALSASGTMSCKLLLVAHGRCGMTVALSLLAVASLTMGKVSATMSCMHKQAS